MDYLDLEMLMYQSGPSYNDSYAPPSYDYPPMPEYPMPDTYYDAPLHHYAAPHAPAYPPSYFSGDYKPYLEQPPTYNHPGYQAPYIDIPTPPPMYMPKNPQPPHPFAIPAPRPIQPPPMATPLSYAPQLEKPLDFGNPPPIEPPPYFKTPSAPYAPSRPGTPQYAPQKPMYYQTPSAPTYKPGYQNPNFYSATPNKPVAHPTYSNVPNYGRNFNFGYQAPQASYQQSYQPSYQAHRPSYGGPRPY